MIRPHDAPSAASLLLLSALLWCAAVPASAQPPDDLELIPVPMLSGFDRAIALRHAGDGSGRLFIVEQAGRIWVWDGASAPSVFLDLTGVVDNCGNEQGLLGLDFHPDYVSNGFFYVNYTEHESSPPPACGQDFGPWNTAVVRYSVSADPDLADPASAVRILTVDQDFANHNGGNILFGPDGYLYVGMGDGGSGGDPNNRSQTLDTLLGKMLRIDVDATPTRGSGDLCGQDSAYGIPPDNPYAGGKGDCDEIWATGLRNPWRFSFDRLTGDLFIGDVGQNQMEEISFQAAGDAGLNFGWSCMEGTQSPGFNSCLPQTLTDPILTYLQNDGGTFNGCAVTGGYRYRGHRIPGFAGTYVYADYCTGRIWFATDDGGWTSSEWMDSPLNVTSFGEAEDGELYVVDENVILYFDRVIFTDGFESGDTSAW